MMNGQSSSSSVAISPCSNRPRSMKLNLAISLKSQFTLMSIQTGRRDKDSHLVCKNYMARLPNKLSLIS